jgi:RNA polymerase sporulation-specific sigma factor
MSLRTSAATDERPDDELALLAQAGDARAQQALLERYRRFVRNKARSYFFAGGDADDVEQEGLIGLYKAIRDYRVDQPASFHSFAELCITRQIISAIKTATRQKHQPLNLSVSISGATGDDAGERNLEELLDDHHVADPADSVISAERMVTMRVAMAELLSSLEVDVLRLHVAGRSYREISDQLGRHTKSIDNALQRIKRKLDQHLTDEAQAEVDLVDA